MGGEKGRGQNGRRGDRERGGRNGRNEDEYVFLNNTHTHTHTHTCTHTHMHARTHTHTERDRETYLLLHEERHIQRCESLLCQQLQRILYQSKLQVHTRTFNDGTREGLTHTPPHSSHSSPLLPLLPTPTPPHPFPLPAHLSGSSTCSLPQLCHDACLPRPPSQSGPRESISCESHNVHASAPQQSLSPVAEGGRKERGRGGEGREGEGRRRRGEEREGREGEGREGEGNRILMERMPYKAIHLTPFELRCTYTIPSLVN